MIAMHVRQVIPKFSRVVHFCRFPMFQQPGRAQKKRQRDRNRNCGKRDSVTMPDLLTKLARE